MENSRLNLNFQKFTYIFYLHKYLTKSFICFQKIIALVAKEIDTLARNTIKEELKSIDPTILSGGGSGLGSSKNSVISFASNSTTINGNEIWDGGWNSGS